MKSLLKELSYNKVIEWTKILKIFLKITNIILKKYLIDYLNIILAIFLISNFFHYIWHMHKCNII